MLACRHGCWQTSMPAVQQLDAITSNLLPCRTHPSNSPAAAEARALSRDTSDSPSQRGSDWLPSSSPERSRASLTTRRVGNRMGLATCQSLKLALALLRTCTVLRVTGGAVGAKSARFSY